MATIVFSAIGGALGSSFLGGIFGAAAGAVIGRAGGALLGNFVDEAIFGRGSQNSKSLDNRGRLADELRITTAYHGAPIAEPYGRVRLGGHLIWASEVRVVEDGDTVAHRVDFAVALGEGPVHRIGRFWLNDVALSIDKFAYQLHHGAEEQGRDPIMVAALGEARCPNFGGIAYVVFEDFDIAPFGDRIPNLEFEVFRHAPVIIEPEIRDRIQAINIIPGSGEFVYATTIVDAIGQPGESQPLNANADSARSDFAVSLGQLRADLPKLAAASLVVSWFGDDLRAAHCTLTPRVEVAEKTTSPEWRVGDRLRTTAQTVSAVDGKPGYGGTPSDDSVIEAIDALHEAGLEVTFYPFILMDIPADNTRDDPYAPGQFQAKNPWRGRITTLIAAGVDGSTDRTALARGEVARFLGSASASDFVIVDGCVSYSGDPEDWGYRRFILHQAFLCLAAGGVERFLIGSELRGLTQIRDEHDGFPFVEALKTLAAEIGDILPDTKISYAADWSEFRGYQPLGEAGAFYFHLDALWADPNIDFIGVDNYTPISDWRHTESHADIDAGHPYNLDYLRANVEGGEGYDWYYASDADRRDQIRTPITDGENEAWIWRYKDIRNWWSNPHFDRPNGVRAAVPSAWIPQSKPIVFCEFGAGAIDLAGNQPNKFLDPNSSESAMPYFSRANSDDLAQAAYIRAVTDYWRDGARNPRSIQYTGQMVDVARMHYWCWDARPWPHFPARLDLWSDGGNYYTGHWINGRVNNISLANLVASICEAAGLYEYDVKRLYGLVPSLIFDGCETAADKLETLMASYFFRAFWRDDTLCFVSDIADSERPIDPSLLVAHEGGALVATETERVADRPDVIELQYFDLAGEYAAQKLVLRAPESTAARRIGVDLNMALDRGFAQNLAGRLLRQARTGRERIRLRLPPETGAIGIGDRISLPEQKPKKSFVVEAITRGALTEVEAYLHTRTNRVPQNGGVIREVAAPTDQKAALWVEPLDLGLYPQAQYFIGVTARPWGGAAALLLDDKQFGRRHSPHAMGRLISALPLGQPHRRQNVVMEIALVNGQIEQSRLAGFNRPMIAIMGVEGVEIIAFDRAELVDNRRYLLHGVYRGVRDTPIGDYEGGEAIISVTSQLVRLASDHFVQNIASAFAYGYLGDQPVTRMLEHPIEGTRPLAPKLVIDAGAILLVPRVRADHDLMANGAWNFRQSGERYRVVFDLEDGSQVVSEVTGLHLPRPANAAAISVSAINIHGLESRIRKENLI